MVKNGLVSVIVPVYNVEEYLPDCISNIQKQTYTNLEIILVDDGSIDCCGKICDEYAKHDSRIKVFHQENKGVSAARNVGLKNMSGEFLIFVDADDEINERYVEVFLHRIKEDGTDVVVQLRDCDPKYNKKIMVIDDNFSYDRWYFPNVTTMKLYRTIITENIYFDEKISNGEDMLFMAQVLIRVSCVSCVLGNFYYVRIRKGSITNSGFSDQYYTVLEAIKRMETIYINRKETYDSVRVKYGFFCKKIYILLIQHSGEEERKKYLLKEARKRLRLVLESKRYFYEKLYYLLFCWMPRVYCGLKVIKDRVIGLRDDTL
ncbi:MAG: glycosyltransferase family 2 protein [Lachnospiraceae bacterium]